MNTKEDMDSIKKEILDSGIDLKELGRSLRIAPSKQQILQMPHNILLKHNAIIFHKGSSLSSAQRTMVQDRVSYGISKGLIKMEDVTKEINILNAAIRSELIKTIKSNDSITK